MFSFLADSGNAPTTFGTNVVVGPEKTPARAPTGADSKDEEIASSLNLSNLDQDLSPLNSWFMLAGRPDFRPAAARRMPLKRQRPASPGGSAVFTRDGKRARNALDSITTGYSWQSWYDYDALDKKIAARQKEGGGSSPAILHAAEEGAAAAKEGAALAVCAEKRQQDGSEKNDLIDMFGQERRKALAFEKKLAELMG